jgi:heat shock protein HslJ
MSRPSSRLLQVLSTRVLAAFAGVVLLAGIFPAASLAQAGADARNFEREWQLLQYRDASGNLTSVPPGISVTMLPFRGTIKGRAACSTYEGTYTLTEETVIVDTPTIDTVGCDAADQAIDDAFYAGLAATRQWSTKGLGSILYLRDEIDQDVMVLTRAKLPSDPTLARWELARLGAADGSIEPVVQGTDPWVEFLRGGRVVGSTGCGSFLGSWVTNDTTIKVQDVDARLGDCNEVVQGQATSFLATLGEITDFEVRPAGLVLKDASGTTRMALVPAIDLGRRTWTPTEVLDANGKVVFGPDRLLTSAVRFSGSGDKGFDGRSICGGFQGGSVRSGLALSTYNLTSTGRACPKPKGDQAGQQDVENAWLDALARTASHALRGDELQLLDVDGKPVMQLVPQAELVGPTWVLAEMDITAGAPKQKLRPPTGTEQLTASFSDVDTGFILGETGVATYSGVYSTPGAGQITISGLETFGGCSKRSAAKPACKQQALFLDLLQAADGFVVEPTQLRLFDTQRPVPLLRFVPSQAVPQATPEASPAPSTGG